MWLQHMMHVDSQPIIRLGITSINELIICTKKTISVIGNLLSFRAMAAVPLHHHILHHHHHLIQVFVVQW